MLYCLQSPKENQRRPSVEEGNGFFNFAFLFFHFTYGWFFTTSFNLNPAMGHNLPVWSRLTFMMMMYDTGSIGAIAPQQQKVHQQWVNIPLLLVFPSHPLEEGIFLLYAVRIKLYFWIWWQCGGGMFLSKNLTTDLFFGKYSASSLSLTCYVTCYVAQTLLV